MSEDIQQDSGPRGALVQQEQPSGALHGRNLPAIAAGANVGAIAIEQERAIAEAQGQLTLAKKFPRNLAAAHAELMESCSIKSFAEVAFYTVPNRGSGPSIRFAEEVARVYSNFQYGHRELSRADGKSEVEVYAWDMQNNNYSKRQITVLHVTDTKNGPKILRDQADIDNRIANVASKQIRGRILALMPKWLVAEAIDKCKATLSGTSDEPVGVRIRKMAQAFSKYGVTVAHIEKYLGHVLDETTVDEIVDLIGIFNAIKEGAKPAEYFSDKEAEAEASANTAGKLSNAAKAGAAAKNGGSQPAAGAQAGAAAAAQKPAASAQSQDAKPQAGKAEQASAQQESKPAKKEGNSVKEDAANAGEAAQEPTGEEQQPPAASGEEEPDLF